MSAIPLTRGRIASRRRDEPQLRVVQETRRRHTLGFAVLVIVLTAGSVFATVALNALAAGDAVAARGLERDVAEAQRRHGELVAEVAHLEDPGRIEEVAVSELGMVPARGARFIVVSADPDAPQLADGVIEGASPDPLKPVLSADR